MTAEEEATTLSSARGYRPGYEIAAEQILELIAQTGLRPGDRLPTEAALGERLHLSRSVVREAVKILSALGRVTAHRGRGLHVADNPAILGSGQSAFFLPTQLSHVYRLFEFRLVCETEATRLAALRSTPPQIKQMFTAARACKDALVGDDNAAFAAADDDFHAAVAAGSDNPFLEGCVVEARRVQRQTARLGTPSEVVGQRFAQAVTEHFEIAEAVRDADADAAAAAARLHVENTLSDYRSHIDQRLAGTNRAVR